LLRLKPPLFAVDLDESELTVTAKLVDGLDRNLEKVRNLRRG
jgi:hypothetical protein